MDMHIAQDVPLTGINVYSLPPEEAEAHRAADQDPVGLAVREPLDHAQLLGHLGTAEDARAARGVGPADVRMEVVE